MRFHLKTSNIQHSTFNTEPTGVRLSSGRWALNVECSTLPRQQASSRSGVALIITVIMLSVITFLAVAFLALSGREKGAVKTSTDQTTARLAADAAFDRAKTELLAGILESGNLENYNFLVSTNYINYRGFQTTGVGDQLTNVNYFYANGSPLPLGDALQNLANLYYDPRPPVFITNRLAANSLDFRFYIDLNRNRQLDLTGFWGVTNINNQPVVVANRFVSNYVVGDPQWIGGTERVGLPHSSSNKFSYRYAFAAVPAGNALDVNYIFDNAKTTVPINGFLRNQGVGGWELNLAAFLADLNTNYWNPSFAPYYYETNIALQSRGVAFDDAYSLLNWRRGGFALPSVQTLYGAVGVNALTRDWADAYSAGPVLDSQRGYLNDPDVGRTSDPWSGADMPNHYFTTQDFFDPTKTSTSFVNQRLLPAGTNVSTYDQYTYYRLLSQLGTDSGPESSDKINLNYKNVGGLSATNFVPWTPLDFFTNAANELLKRYSQEWRVVDRDYYRNFFGTNQAFGLANIPVLVSNRFVYTASVNRLLQVAANLAEPRTNILVPSMFRPIFNRDSSRGDVYISGYEQVPTNGVNTGYLNVPISVEDLPNGAGIRTNVYGVPWIIGARTGLPNFNEFAMDTFFQITRKLQITRPSLNANQSSWRTNQMFVMAITNAIGVEAWNSYRPDFTNTVLISVIGDVTMVLTNEFGIPLSSAGPLNRTIPISGFTTLAGPTYWKGTGPSPSYMNLKSLVVPLRTNIAFLPESVYRVGAGTFTTNLSIDFETGLGFAQPQWGLTTSARLRFVMQLNDANGPVIDYVQLDELGSTRKLSEEIQDPDFGVGFAGLWSTNYLRNSTVPQGVFNQIDISMGNHGTDSDQWKVYDRNAGNNVEFAVANFRALYLGGGPTNLEVQVPFTPTARRLQRSSWQANDPLVHYLAGDLSQTNYIDESDFQFCKNISSVNNRYSPWGGNPLNRSEGDPNLYATPLKDPAVTSSDAWQFPTNALPGVGWIGRIHRGTPWQTIYLKASDLDIPEFTAPMTNLNVWVNSYAGPATRWGEWSGNPNFFDAYYTRPATDRMFFDVFTTSINDNASRGQLSVNQTNLAAWSAVFSGVVVLTNSTPPGSMNANAVPRYAPLVIDPAGNYDPYSGNLLPPLVRLVSGINLERSRTFAGNTPDQFVHRGGWFQSAGDILSVPALSLGSPVFVPDDPNAQWPRAGVYYWTNSSPFLSFGNAAIRGKSDEVPTLNTAQLKYTMNDAALEWLPQQVMSLLRFSEPRFIIYSYGQALRPAENSIVTSGGPFFGMCTNYQIVAEVASRAVVRVVGSADKADADNVDAKRRYPPRLEVESYNYLEPE